MKNIQILDNDVICYDKKRLRIVTFDPLFSNTSKYYNNYDEDDNNNDGNNLKER